MHQSGSFCKKEQILLKYEPILFLNPTIYYFIAYNLFLFLIYLVLFPMHWCFVHMYVRYQSP